MSASDENRPHWEKPQILELDDLDAAVGVGGCFSGSHAANGSCASGIVPATTCVSGTGVGPG